ncbi:MAG: radical SAM protein [Candidatus Omnitrophica bacterium]|nr:radical SAM protein [Candidatus Omnitrophota bacterium]MDD5352373.1 radical SAM protein [Candidatus Omnitrophota bacterium]MDD5549971.1 radical SAM protein [Candidatus Omnitrophota bacterium]
MKTLLVKPYNLTDHIQPSLGLGYLATAIRNKSDVRILDCIKERVEIEQLGEIIKNYKPDLVGFQCYTFDLRFLKDALNIVKNYDEKIITVMGGPHPSAVPQQTMEYFGNKLDFAFKGEAEKSFSLFVDYLNGEKINFSDIPGFVWRKNGTIESNDCYFENNLDSLGMLSWDLIHPEQYPESQHGAFYKKFPIAPIMITRGCPYQCTFCAGKLVSGVKLRKRGIKEVINEIDMLYKDYGIREFHVIDDNFTLDVAYAKTFLRELIVKNLDISWSTPNGVRMDMLDKELLALMKQSGLYLISLGIESGSDRILKLMKKNLTVEKIRKSIALIKSCGIDIAGFFILGFPGEKKEEIMDTINLSLELDLIRANFFTYLPFPGTESYSELAKNGELERVNWDRFYFMNSAYTPIGISRKELKRLHRIAFLRFYARPKILWKNILSIKSLRHLLFLTKRFYHWIVMS